MKEDEIFRILTDPMTTKASRKEEEEFLFSPELIEQFSSPAFLGEIPDPDGYALEKGDCGDSMEAFLSVRDGIIEKACFDTLGCGYTIACGNKAMELSEGRPVSEALGVTPQRIEEALGGLPASHRHCAELAAGTLRKAVEDFLARSEGLNRGTEPSRE